MPRLRAVLAAALTLGALVVPRAGAEPTRDIVLTGSSSGWLILETNYQIFGRPVVETRGRYGGFYVEMLSSLGGGDRRTQSGGWLAIRGLDAQPGELVTQPLGRAPQTRPGRMRLYLIADGPTTVRIPTQSYTRGETYRPERAARTQFRMAPLTSRDGAWQGDLPLRVARGGIALAASQADGDATLAVADAQVCLRAPRAPCEDSPTRYVPSVEGDASAMERRWSDASVPDAGPYGDLLATARLRSHGPVRRAVLAAFAIDLVG